MAEICCGVQKVTTTECDKSPQAARRRRMEIRRVKLVAGVSPMVETGNGLKRQRLEFNTTSQPASRQCDEAFENHASDVEKNPADDGDGKSETVESSSIPNDSSVLLTPMLSTATSSVPAADLVGLPKFGAASVCGRRRDMEDAIAIHPSFFRGESVSETAAELHYFGVYDGHGCSHAATKCRERLHELVKEELEVVSKVESTEWKKAMERSFIRMDKEVISWNQGVRGGASCRCELRTPECHAVGSTAVVAVVTPSKIIVANCGDSRAVLCRNGKSIPLSTDHKPDRPDEMSRIQAVGGRVIYWDGPRVLGVLAMSRAIGDNYLKPYVSSEPEVTITERTAEDDCLILASDGLWDVVSNDTACGVARMCLKGKAPAKAEGSASWESESDGEGCVEKSDKACSVASMLLTKLALARRSTDNVSVVVIDLSKHSVEKKEMMIQP